MHIIELKANTPLQLPAGRYLCENTNAGEFLLHEWGLIYAPSESEIMARSFDAEKDWNGKRILFVRPGGYGDLLFLTPTIREIKRRWPEAQVHVSCFKNYFDALEHNPDVAAWCSYPVAVDEWNGFDAQIWLENFIERDPRAREIHAVDLVAERTGIADLLDKTMKYYRSTDEVQGVMEKFSRTAKPRAGIQASASGAARTYPHIGAVANELWRAGWEVFLFGSPGEIDAEEAPGVVNLSARRTSFRESCAILASCDVAVAPDSALCHVAGALDIPTVALFGPFPWKLRTAYAGYTFAITGQCGISPCFHHKRPNTFDFPRNGPCFKTGRCEALAGIEVKRVVSEVEKRRPVQSGKVLVMA